MVARFGRHLPCAPPQRMVFGLFDHCQLSPGVLNCRNRQNTHSTTEWKSDHPTLSLASTQSKKESYLHQQVSRRWVQDDTERVIMAHYKRKSLNRPWCKIQQLVPTHNDQLEGITKCSRIADIFIVARPTQPYVKS